MSADRIEKMAVNRTTDKTMVKVSLTEDGVTVSYTVKTYESQVGEAAKTARAGAERMLKQVIVSE